ncbi:hypothetical protein K443DRAFT_684768, partial [Laccaria amethystina LaAM-08-1]
MNPEHVKCSSLGKITFLPDISGVSATSRSLVRHCDVKPDGASRSSETTSGADDASSIKLIETGEDHCRSRRYRN